MARSWRETLIVGHRGAAAYARENTLPAFEAGIASGACAVECDVHLSAEGEVVVIHDRTLDRTTPLVGAVSQTPWAAMREVGVPSLAEVARAVKDRATLIVELKAGTGVERRVVEVLRREGIVDAAIVFDFDADRLARIAPDVTTVCLVDLPPEGALDRVAAGGARGIGINHRALTPAFAIEARRREIPVFAWTVPPGEAVERIRRMEVNFIVTDHPRDVRAQLGH